MQTATTKVLNRLGKHLGDEYFPASDYRIAKELGVTRQAVSNWRKRGNAMDDAAVLRAATILGEAPAALLAMVAADRTQDAEARKVWTKLSKQLRGTAAVITVGALGITGFQTAKAIGTTAQVRIEYILC